MAAGFCKLVEDTCECSKSAQIKVTPHPRVPSAAAWTTPKPGWVKVNVAAHVGVNKVVGLGAVIRDSQGGLLVTAATRMNAAWDARMAEAAAARYRVMIARRFGSTNVCLEGDVLSVISIFEQTHGICSYLLFILGCTHS